MLLESTNAMTELLCLSDAYRCEFDAVALDAPAFFPTGGGQPNDIGELTFADMSAAIADVVKDREGIAWHTLAAESPLPALDQELRGIVDWRRRYLIMRLHTAQHVMNGMIWRDHGAHVTGGQITPPGARLDFELATMSQEFAPFPRGGDQRGRAPEPAGARALAPRAEADNDPSLIRLKANLIPRAIDPLRVIDSVHLDRQADGGTHVAATGEVGRVRVVKTESKGKANKRLRIAVDE